MINWHDVVVCYEPNSRHPVNALDNVSLRVAAGEWVFFVGPSGAGKSTLLKLVYGGAHVHKGQVSVDGQDVTRLAAREIPLLRRKIGVVFQDFQLLGQKTVWENVAFALQVIGAPQKRLVRDVPRALETVGLAHKATARPHELSGGEAQRVAIARAIVNDPLILIADEPTGNLDPQTASDIAQVLQRINERGTTILMATHDRALVDQMKNRVVRIASGRVVSDQAQGEYHPEDDALPLAANATNAVSATNAIPIASQNAAPVFAAVSKTVVSAPFSPNVADVAPPDVKIHKPVSAFTGQIDAAPVADPSLVACGARMSTHAASSPTPNVQTPTSTGKVQAPVTSPATQAATTQAATSATISNSSAPVSTVAPAMPAAKIAQPSTATPAVTPKNATLQEPAIAPTHAAGNGEASFHDSIDRARLNQAPIGSPENPIIQLDRAPEVQMPHEVEA